MRETNDVTDVDFVEKSTTFGDVWSEISKRHIAGVLVWMTIAEQLKLSTDGTVQYSPKQLQLQLGLIAEEMSELVSELLKSEEFSKKIPVELCDNLKQFSQAMKKYRSEEPAKSFVNKTNAAKLLDHFADIAWVSLGGIAALGSDPESVFYEVMASNFEKFHIDAEKKVLYAKRDENGKVLKPDGWTPPRLESFVSDQIPE
jgi:predicted HAD superfamily Cof-like phosphohydrolase